MGFFSRGAKTLRLPPPTHSTIPLCPLIPQRDGGLWKHRCSASTPSSSPSAPPASPRSPSPPPVSSGCGSVLARGSLFSLFFPRPTPLPPLVCGVQPEISVSDNATCWGWGARQHLPGWNGFPPPELMTTSCKFKRTVRWIASVCAPKGGGFSPGASWELLFQPAAFAPAAG